jgi:undecaprenyl diphosphate synthase
MRVVETKELQEIRSGKIPTHVSCIMDGNGRWAEMRGLPRNAGHYAAQDAIMAMVDAVLELGIPWLSVYAFSTENWDRPPEEVDYLMHFDEWLLEKRRDELNDKGVRIRFIGRHTDSRVESRTLNGMSTTETMTADNTKLTLVIAFNYGGRAEIVDACRALIDEKISSDEVDEARFGEALYDPDMPDIDLLIRTSGEHRISNFLLWQVAYSEFVFTDTLFPDFRSGHLYSAVREYQARMRRKGTRSVS